MTKTQTKTWKPPMTKRAARDYLDGTYKAAAIGGEQESGFEQAFSSLAYAYLKDKAPKLIEFIIGFQLVDRNEDSTKAVGVFGFKAGDQWLYAPVFFLNADLKGHELLYIKKQDRFVPLKENWVNYLMSRKPHILGEGSQEPRHLGGQTPNIEQLSYPPTQSKFGSDRAIPEWALGVLPLMGAAQSLKAKAARPDAEGTLSLEKYASAPVKFAMLGLGLTVPEVLQDCPNLVGVFSAIGKKYPGVKKAYDQVYGDGQFQILETNCHRRLGQRRVKAASCIVPPPAAPRHGANFLEKRAASDKIEILTDPSVVIKRNIETGVSDEERAKLFNDGYLVKDFRTGDEVSVAYNTTTGLKLTNPDSSGIYDVLERPGKFNKLIVIKAPHTNADQHRFAVVFRPKGSGRGRLNADPSKIWARDKRPDSEFREWFEGVDDASLKLRGTYIAVSSSGQGTTPFCVNKILGDGTYKVDFRKYPDSKFRRSASAPRMAERSSSYDDEYISTYNGILRVNSHNGSELRRLSGELYVPKTFKFIQLESPPPARGRKANIMDCSDECITSTDNEEEEDCPIQPGRIEDIQLLFTEKLASLEVISDAHEVHIQGEKSAAFRGSWKSGLFHLIQSHGLSEKQADDILATAKRKRTGKFRVKYAFGFPETAGAGPGAPGLPEPHYGSVQVGYGQQRAQFPMEQHIPIPGMDSSMTDPSVYDPFSSPDPHAMQAAQQAGQRGQKEVFDTAMIGSMLKAVRQDSLVDRYLGTLMKALDHLGRVLFMFYWHGDEFEDRYGKSDLPELEDSLRNSFESLGDLVLFLKEKTSGPDTSLGGPDITESTGE